jgi:Icc-related predicted phosphoesterase
MKFIIGIFLISIIPVFFPFPKKGITANTPVQEFPDSVLTAGDRNSSIIVIGDIQRTSIWEYFIGREENDPERILMINEIARLNPAAVVLLGDMVFDGSDRSHWAGFDSLFIPVTRNNIPVLPILGNHEYFGNKVAAFRNLKKRFPLLVENRWYSKVYNGVGLVFLDSNESYLKPATRLKQREWYKETITTFDNDPSIKGVIVFLHHPPYSNSVITGDEPHVQRNFVPAFVNAKKTLVMVSGHAHTYERFEKNDKKFIVSGGGGGPRVILRTGKNTHNDLCSAASPRPFHFLKLDVQQGGVTFTVNALDKRGTEFFVLEQFSLPFK